MDLDLLSFVGGVDGGGVCTAKNKFKKQKKKEKVKSNLGNNSNIPDDDFVHKKTTLADLTTVLGDEVGAIEVKQNIARISNSRHEKISNFSDEPNKKIRKIDVLIPQLDMHRQTQMEREAAWELSRRQGQRWIPIIKRQRAISNRNFLPGRAEPLTIESFSSLPSCDLGNHELPGNLYASSVSFTRGAEGGSLGNSNGIQKLPTASVKRISLAQKIQGVLKAANLADDEKIIESEQLEMAALSVEEVEKRYGMLAKRRALMLYAERKKKQQAKIKSKAFRKQVRREKMKEASSATEKSEVEDDYSTKKIQAEMARIRERMELRTRRANKWAHDQISGRKLDSGAREVIMEQVREKKRLREEIYGKVEDYESDSHESEDRLEEDFSEVSDNGFDAEVISHSDDDDEVDKIFKEKEEDEPAIVGRRVFKATLTNSSQEVPSVIGSGSLSKNIVNVGLEASLPSISKDSDNEELLDKSKSGIYLTSDGGLSQDVRSKFSKLSSLAKKVINKESVCIERRPSNLREHVSERQIELVKEAFMGDDVFAAFEERKAEEVKKEGPKDIDLTLPGWGQWGGLGVSHSNTKIQVIKRSRDGVAPKDRRDASLRHVVIHEGRAKSSAVLMVDRPAAPFKTQEEHDEFVGGTPRGREWSSATAFVKGILPKVRTTAGCIIDPVQFSTTAS